MLRSSEALFKSFERDVSAIDAFWLCPDVRLRWSVGLFFSKEIFSNSQDRAMKCHLGEGARQKKGGNYVCTHRPGEKFPHSLAVIQFPSSFKWDSFSVVCIPVSMTNPLLSPWLFLAMHSNLPKSCSCTFVILNLATLSSRKENRRAWGSSGEMCNRLLVSWRHSILKWVGFFLFNVIHCHHKFKSFWKCPWKDLQKERVRRRFCTPTWPSTALALRTPWVCRLPQWEDLIIIIIIMSFMLMTTTRNCSAHIWLARWDVPCPVRQPRSRPHTRIRRRPCGPRPATARSCRCCTRLGEEAPRGGRLRRRYSEICRHFTLRSEIVHAKGTFFLIQEILGLGDPSALHTISTSEPARTT